MLPAREMLRSPITLLLTISPVFITLLIPVILAFQFGDTGKRLVRDGGLGLQLTSGVLLAATCACSLIQKERESGIAAMLLTKPVGRVTYLLSRFAGIAIILLLFSLTATLATMLAHRAAASLEPSFGFRTDYITASAGLTCLILAACVAGWRNWKHNDSFHAVATVSLPILLAMLTVISGFYTRTGHITMQYNPQLDARILLAAFALYLLLLIFAALALTMSIHLKPVSTAISCMLILFGGFATPVLLAKENLARPLTAFLPNWNWFWIANHLDTGQKELLPSFAFLNVYGIFFITAILLLGIICMQKAEVPS